MFDSEREIQIDRVLEALGTGSGLSDNVGNVLFGEKRGEIISLPNENDVDKDGFFFDRENGRLLCFIKPLQRDSVWIFTESENSEATKKLLTLVVTLGETFFYNIAVQKNSFFKQLLTGGYQAVSPNDFTLYTKNLANIAGEFTVVRVELIQKDANDENSISSLEECLRIVFPDDLGYVQTRIDMNTIAIICPINEQNPFKTIQQIAGNVKDTIMAELMQASVVSLGGRVRAVKSLDLSYKTAERAGIIGNIFEFTDKCFSYDSLGPARLIYSIQKETCITYLRETFGSTFIEERTKKAKITEFTDELLNTIKVFLSQNQNISEASRELYIHRNTLIYRIEKFNKLTGLDCTKFEDGMKIQLGFMILKYVLKT